MSITKKQINLAISRFKKGERPFSYRDARSWYVIGEDDKLYPLKYIYALAVNKKPASFNTSEPISVCKQLGIELLHQPQNENDAFYQRVKESLKDADSRRKRLKASNKLPIQKKVEVVVYERNPDVVAEVLERAKGVCEGCSCLAPFVRKKDNTPYLEVHHKIQLAKGGDDTVENAEALCPNCHRERHYG